MDPAALLVALIACNPLSSCGDSAVKLAMTSGRPVVDGAFVDGQGPLRFLVDTAAQTNQVESSIAGKLSAKPAFRVEMATVAGTALVPAARGLTISLGPASAPNQEFLFTDLTAIHTLSSGIHGVLGQEFLSRFDYLLDFANRRLLFSADPPAGGVRLPFELIDGRPAIATSEGRLVLDSGTDTTILFRSSAPDLAAKIRTASGFAPASSISNLRLKIGTREYRAAKAVSIARPSQAEDGELAASLFHAIFVSNSQKYVILDPPLPVLH